MNNKYKYINRRILESNESNSSSDSDDNTRTNASNKQLLSINLYSYINNYEQHLIYYNCITNLYNKKYVMFH
jgi:hypothetical protein